MMMMMMMPIYTLLNISYLYADDDARSMIPSRNTRSYTLRSVPSSPGRSFLSLFSSASLSWSSWYYSSRIKESSYKWQWWWKSMYQENQHDRSHSLLIKIISLIKSTLMGRSPQICTVRDSVTSQKNIFFPSILKFLKITSLKYMC